MKGSWPAWSVVLAIGAGGCSIEDIPFRCDSDDDCVNGGSQGSCEASGYCGFSDAACDSGRRYGKYAPGELASKCVPRCVEQLALGQYHSCARLADGTLECWGDARKGQLGNGISATESYPSPVTVASEVFPAVDVSAGQDHTCSVRGPEGSIWCWGSNEGLRLGVDKAQAPGPVQVEPIGWKDKPALQVAAGVTHTCARSGGGLRCWGADNFGQLGNGKESLLPLPPVPVAIGKDVLSVAVGAAHTCAVPSIGALMCWGNNSNGQVGKTPPANVLQPFELPIVATQVSLGAGHTCALANGRVVCVGNNDQLQLGAPKPGEPVALAQDATLISAGYAHTCALLVSGTLACWGSNQYGQLGPALEPGPPSGPVGVDLGVPITQLSCGREHTCAVTKNDRVYCWGRNDFGQLGNGESGSTTAHPEPDARVTRDLCAGL